MFYRENGQFKTSYRADQQIFPIAQDRWLVLALIAAAFVLVPMLASDYLMRAIVIPFLIMSLAALGVNILVGTADRSRWAPAPSWRWAPNGLQLFRAHSGMPLIPALLLAGCAPRCSACSSGCPACG